MASDHAIGDILLFALGTLAGDGIFIGRLKAAPEVLVLIVGQQPVEIDAAVCTSTRRGLPAEGASWRRSYLKDHPGALLD